MPNNYTVTTNSATAEAGAQVDITLPKLELIITADAGYTVTAGDFSIGDALPSEVDSVNIFQDGLVVQVDVYFAASFIMPAADVDLPIDIDGAAALTQYSVAGTYEIETSNTDQSNAPAVAYSGSGDLGEQITLFTLTFVADADHAFDVLPQALVYLTNAFPNSYEITYVDQTSTHEGETKVDERAYTVKYTLGAETTTGDTLKFTANAAEQLVIGEGGLEKYYSYRFQDFDVQDVDGDYYTDRSAQMHILQIFGDVGALVTVDWDDGGGSSNLYTNEEITFAGGYLKLPIEFPVVGVDTDYDITLSGDISASFLQPNPIIVHADAGTTVVFSHDALAGYTIVRTGDYTFTRIPGPVPVIDFPNYQINATFTITADDGSDIAFLRTPTWGDISNTDQATNGGTEFLFTPSLVNTGNGTDTVTVQVTGTITKFGTGDISCDISFVNLFNANPIAVDDTATCELGEQILIDVLSNDSDNDGHTLAPVIVTQPTYGTATIVGTQIRYTHDGTENYADSFTYQASDGYSVSNTATVDIVVGIAPGDSLELSATDGIFYIPVVIGDGAGEFTVHFDAGSTADRIELVYDNNIVADSLFIGDYLTDGSRAGSITTIEGTTALNIYDYVGSGGDGTDTGQTNAWQLRTLASVVAYADPDDIAPTGNVRGVTSNYGDQVGVGNLVYTSVGDVVGTTGLDSADGNASISYTKASGGETVIYIKVTGIAGTGWSIYQTSFA